MIALAIVSFDIEAMNPVPQPLAIHAIYAGRICLAGLVTDCRQGQKRAQHSRADCPPQVTSEPFWKFTDGRFCVA